MSRCRLVVSRSLSHVTKAFAMPFAKEAAPSGSSARTSTCYRRRRFVVLNGHRAIASQPLDLGAATLGRTVRRQRKRRRSGRHAHQQVGDHAATHGPGQVRIRQRHEVVVGAAKGVHMDPIFRPAVRRNRHREAIASRAERAALLRRTVSQWLRRRTGVPQQTTRRLCTGRLRRSTDHNVYAAVVRSAGHTRRR